MTQSDDLLQWIRRRSRRVISKQNCRMRGGPGTGGICVACEQPIVANDVEVECDLPRRNNPAPSRVLRRVVGGWPTCDA
jgi:hypothetical protein